MRVIVWPETKNNRLSKRRLASVEANNDPKLNRPRGSHLVLGGIILVGTVIANISSTDVVGNANANISAIRCQIADMFLLSVV